MKIYRGDLKPDLRVVLTDNGIPISLADVSSAKVIGKKNKMVFFSRPGIVDTDLGVVRMEWEVNDTRTTGIIEIEVEVTWRDGKPQTFRPADIVNVVEDFG